MNDNIEVKMKIIENIGKEYDNEHTDAVKMINKFNEPSYKQQKISKQ